MTLYLVTGREPNRQVSPYNLITDQTGVGQLVDLALSAADEATLIGAGMITPVVADTSASVLPLNPLAYNAKFDWQAYYANTTSGSNRIHVGANTKFTDKDVGKQMIVKKAGNAGGTQSLWGYIGGATGGDALLYTDLTYSTPANAASTQSGAEVAWGSDDTAALNSCFAAAVANGGRRLVQLPPGWARASQLKIPNGIKIRSAGWGDGWGVFAHLNSGSNLGSQNSTLGTLLQQLEGATTDFITFNSDNFNSDHSLSFLGPLDVELGVVQGCYVPGAVGSPSGTQDGISLRTPDDATHANVPGRPQDGFRLANTHVIGFPGDGFNLPNGVVPLQGFINNRAFYNGGYGFRLTSISGGEIQMCHLENFSADANSSGAVLVDGFNQTGGGVVKITGLKAEANSFTQQNVARNSHEWTPANDIAQLNCVTLNNCTGHVVVEADHICAAFQNPPTNTVLYAPGPLITITGTGSPDISLDGNVRTFNGDSIFSGSAGPIAINDVVNTVVVPRTVRRVNYAPTAATFPYPAATKATTQTVSATGEALVIALLVPANTLKVGSQFRLRARGTLSASASGGLLANLKAGTNGTTSDSAIRSTTSITGSVTTATGWEFDGDVTVQAVGSGTAGKLNGNGKMIVATTISQSVGTGQLSIDTTVDNYIDLTLTVAGSSPVLNVTNAVIEPVHGTY